MEIDHVTRLSSEISHIVRDWSSPKHIAASEINHVAHSPLIEDRSSVVTTSTSAFRPPYSRAPSRYFILLTSLSFSLWLSLSLSLFEITEMKWIRVSLFLYSLRLTLSDSFELWLAEALTLLIFCLFFDFLNLALSYPLVLVLVLVRY